MGRHAMVELDRPAVLEPRTVVVPRPVPAPRGPLLPAPVATPTPTPTGFPRPAWVPPGYDAPPAGLDRPLDGPPVAPRTPHTVAARPARRTTAAAVIGAVGAGIALLATGGTALGALAQTATPTAPAPTHVASATAQQCSHVVAGLLDDTASTLAAGSRASWSSTVTSRAATLATTYGRDSAEYSAYVDGAAEIVDWLSDSRATESYSDVVGRVVPTVVATCDRAYR